MSTVPPSQEPTAGQLSAYLFGNQYDPKDVGIIGRLMQQHDELAQQVRDSNEALREEMKATNQRFGRLLNLGWAILLLFIAAVLSFAGTLAAILVTHHP